MNYKRALTRKPGPSFNRCISDHPLKKYLDIGMARRQHEVYCSTLKELGLEVFTLAEEENYPDACFVEDTTVVHGNKAFITRLAKESRQGEESAIINFLRNQLKIKIATSPAIIEGGDVGRRAGGKIEQLNLHPGHSGSAPIQLPLDDAAYFTDHHDRNLDGRHHIGIKVYPVSFVHRFEKGIIEAVFVNLDDIFVVRLQAVIIIGLILPGRLTGGAFYLGSQTRNLLLAVIVGAVEIVVDKRPQDGRTLADAVAPVEMKNSRLLIEAD